MTKKKPQPLNEIEHTTLWMAIRYAMGRQTIASATLPDDIIKYYYHRLSNNEKELICRDLQSHFKDFNIFGHKDIDNPKWMKFWACLDEKNHKTVKLIDGTECVIFETLGRKYPLKEYIEYPYKEIYVPDENIIP